MIRQIIFASLLTAPFIGNLAAQEMVYPDTIIVLDVSNSMWGQIDGKAKISIAREVIGELVHGLDTDSEFGLMAFGHRRKTSCNDIELILPVGPLDPAAFSAAVNKLQPYGRTPLTAAIREAARVLKTQERSGRVILVSDGIESCDADPCALAQELEDSGLDFTAHVLGFDVSEVTDQSQLSCIAKNTEGLYLTAESANELKDALEFMMMQGDEGHMDEGETQASTITSAGIVAPLAQFSVEWTGPDAAGDFIAIALIGSEPTAFKSAASTSGGSPMQLTSPEILGTYELRYVSKAQDKVLARTSLRVKGE